MWFSRRSSSNSLLESSTCHNPLGRRNGGLFWTLGNFPDSPCMSMQWSVFHYMSVKWPLFHYMSMQWPVFHYMSVKWPVFHYMWSNQCFIKSVQWPVFHCSQHITNTNLMQHQLIFFWVQACCSKRFSHKFNKLWSLAQSRSANHQPPCNVKLATESQISFMRDLRFSQWYCVLGCDVMQVGKQFLTFQRSKEHLS